MEQLESQLSEEELADALADALTEEGFSAFSQDTGGGMMCVVLECNDGGEIAWGTADETWAAAVSDAHGEYVSGIQTDCPSGSRDIASIVDALKRPSLQHGAVFASVS